MKLTIISSFKQILDQQGANCCQQRFLDTKENTSKTFVCVCNKNYCDSLNFDWNFNKSIVQVVSSYGNKPFELRYPISRYLTSNGKQLFKDGSNIRVDLSKKRQSIIGFGGAFTDAAMINLIGLSEKLQSDLLESYFGKSGLQYTLGRVPIAGTDFSTRIYSYDDVVDDYSLSNWSLADEDKNLKIPNILKAMQLVRKSSGNDLKLFASPWSPPAWMKTSNYVSRGHLIKDPKVYQAYAEYLMKFFEAYREHKIEFWGATVQNEPGSAYYPFYWFNSLEFSPLEQIEFITKYYGPALEARGYNKTNFKLMIGDDNIEMINLQVPIILNNTEVSKYVSGLAFHWYTSALWPRSWLTKLQARLKGKIDFVLMTEACSGSNPIDRGVRLGGWAHGEAYARDIIEDLRRNSGGWVDWNMMLDENGSPSWAKNYVDAPIIVNKTSDEFYKQPMYYSLAHFSKFFRPDDIVVESDVNLRGVYVVAATRVETKHTMVNVLNTKTKQIKTSLVVKVSEDNYHTFDVSLDPKSINSFVIRTE